MGDVFRAERGLTTVRKTVSVSIKVDNRLYLIGDL